MPGMSVSQPQPRLAAHSLDDLVGLVPYLVGFHPAESLVTLIVQDGRVEVTARVDLVAVDEPDALGRLLGRLFERFSAAQAWFFAYSQDAGLAWRVLQRCSRLAGAVRLGRVVHVGADGWRGDDPDGPSGGLVPSAAAAQAVVLGLPACRGRQVLVDSIAAPPDSSGLWRALGRIGEELEVRSPAARSRAALGLVCVEDLDGDDCLRLALLGNDPQVQLAVLRRLDLAGASRCAAAWTRVLQRSPGQLRAGPVAMLAMSSWLTGNGALSSICLEELERVDPFSPVAAMVAWLIDEVVPPSHWPRHRVRLLGDLSDATAAGPPVGRPGR